jgi:hypothetical protein
MVKPSSTRLVKPSAKVKKPATKHKTKQALKKVNPSVKPATVTPTVSLPSVPPAWLLGKQALRLLWSQRSLFISLTLTYGLLELVFVKGFAGTTDVRSLKTQLSSAFSSHFGNILSSLTITAVLVGSAGSGSSDTSGIYQLVLFLVGSLAIVWALRQVSSGSVVRVRDCFYRGMYPLVPLILVVLMIGLQLLPLVIGSGLYGIVVANNIAVNSFQDVIWGIICIIPALLSIYWITASVFGLYIVTLPDMTPLQALRSAKELVEKRRLIVLRKVLFLPLVLAVVAATIMVPIIIVLAPLAQWVFFVLTIFALTITHAYFYTVYRELLHE